VKLGEAREKVLGQLLHLNPGNKYPSIKGHKSISRDQDVEVLLNMCRRSYARVVRKVTVNQKNINKLLSPSTPAPQTQVAGYHCGALKTYTCFSLITLFSGLFNELRVDRFPD